jgi:hypothetical protein
MSSMACGRKGRNPYTISDQESEDIIDKPSDLVLLRENRVSVRRKPFEGVFIMLMDYLNSTMTVTSPLADTKTEGVYLTQKPCGLSKHKFTFISVDKKRTTTG